MGCTTRASEISFAPSKIYWGKEQCRDITFIDDVSGSLEGEYLDLNVLNSTVESKYYLFLDNGSSVDPEIAGKTAITVTYTDDDTAATIAGLAKTAVELVTGFKATVAGDVLNVKNFEMGEVTEEIYTNAPSLTIANSLGLGGYLGKTNEAIEIAIETTSFEVTSNQTAENIIDEIITGTKASCSAGFIELTTARLKTLIAGAVGGTDTPLGGTEMIGAGSGSIGTSLINKGGKLILHPLSALDDDYSEDFIFWKSAPKPESINYSGTDVKVLTCGFVAYGDTTKPANIDVWATGDWTQY